MREPDDLEHHDVEDDARRDAAVPLAFRYPPLRGALDAVHAAWATAFRAKRTNDPALAAALDVLADAARDAGASAPALLIALDSLVFPVDLTAAGAWQQMRDVAGGRVIRRYYGIR